jgi:surface polysaccharide O-acyltransferase-like enzyme
MGRDWSLIAGLSTLIFMLGWIMVGTHTGSSGGFNLLAFGSALLESFLVVGLGMGLLVLFRQRWNHQGRVSKELAADVYTVYLIHPVVLVGFAYLFSVVALYPLLKWGIAAGVTIPLCFLISSLIRRIPLVNRVL